MTNDSQNNPRDDEVLAQLFKQGAKETPPAKLNDEILKYAANPDQSDAATSNSVGSHFGGGWKVPLSMAASVVVVFALLVQLDQNPQQLELPPVPKISTPTEHNEELLEADEAFANDASSLKNDKKESELSSQNSGTIITDNPVGMETQRSADEIQVAPSTINKNMGSNPEEKATISRERIQIKQESTIIPSAPSTSPSTTSSKAEEGYTKPSPEKLEKPHAAKKQMQAPAQESLNRNAVDTAPGAATQEKFSYKRRDSSNTSDLAADAEDVTNEPDSTSAPTEAEFAPIPVEDWLLMIEKLVAQKDYAEAARQLTKFKQAHPEVNVEDLDAKIP